MTKDAESLKRYRYLLLCSDGGQLCRKVILTPRPLETIDDLVSIETNMPFFRNGEVKILAYTLMAVGTNDGANKYHYKPKL